MTRDDEPAGGRHIGVVECGEQLFDGIGRQRRVGVNGHRERGAHLMQREILRTGLGPGIRRRSEHRCAAGPGDVACVVGGAVIDNQNFVDLKGLGPNAAHRIGNAGGLVVRRYNDGQIPRKLFDRELFWFQGVTHKGTANLGG